MSYDIIPLNERVAIQEMARAERIGSIIVPDSSKEIPTMGTIVAVGPDALSIEVGDIVVYGRYSGTQVEVEGQSLLIMKESDILCQLKEKA